MFSLHKFGTCKDAHDIYNSLKHIIDNPALYTAFEVQEEGNGKDVETSSDEEKVAPGKKQKNAKAEYAEYHTALTKRIDKKKLGVFEVDINKCDYPPKSREVRKVCRSHVLKIKNDMLRNPEISLTSAKPLVGIVLNCTKDNFNSAQLDSYRIQIVDGNHNIMAQKQCLEETEQPVYKKRFFLLYTGLTDQEVHFLGVTFNRLASQSLKMSEMDYCILLRKHLYTICGLSEFDDPPAETPKLFTQYMASLLDLKCVSSFSFNKG
jgi:hypothetical protein